MEKQQERADDARVGVAEGASLYGADGFVGGHGNGDAYQVVLSAPTLEQAEVLREFGTMLASVLRDGGKKRAAGLKPSWKVDTSHMPAIYSHLSKYWHGEEKDADSGQHPFVHLACRALMIAWQETHRGER